MLVRGFGRSDIPFATQLSHLEGWGVSAEDYEGLLELEPYGCFVAEEDGETVGMVTTIAYGKLGWIANLTVKSPCRRRGYGRALLDAAVGYLLDNGVRTVAVDATLQAVPFYERSGFSLAYVLLHLRRAPLPAPPRVSDTLVPMQDKNLHAVAMFDWACFGGRRQRVLRRLLARSPVALLVEDREGVGGYLMARRTNDEWVIGPWVCVRSAEPLLTAALEAIGSEPVSLAVPKVNQHALSILREGDFTVYYREMRMYHGDQEGLGHPQRIYATASPQEG
jgi:GNAT superfamily N-acetyltransferase